MAAVGAFRWRINASASIGIEGDPYVARSASRFKFLVLPYASDRSQSSARHPRRRRCRASRWNRSRWGRARSPSCRGARPRTGLRGTAPSAAGGPRSGCPACAWLMISSGGSSGRQRRIRCGWRTSPISEPGRGGCIWPPCRMRTRGGSWDGRWPTTCARISSSTRSRWLSRVVVRRPGSSITPTRVRSPDSTGPRNSV